ncbi:MAG TPA: LysR family transcriptional regulator [Phototrophicaceae bacterium]|nr:LysR family transcriptional regulator [Phototrophicaceae bacterium]
MDLRQLKTFQTVAATLSFTRAAEQLDYAQSSVTAQVRALEDELGVQLFDRLGRRVTLTDAGERLLDYAEKMLKLADEAALALAESSEPTGKLIIAAPETLSTYRLPPLLKQFRTRYPRVQLILRSFLVPETLARLADGSVDVAVLLTDAPPDSNGLMIVPLVEEHLLLLAAPEHHLNDGGCVQPDDLRDESLLLTEAGCSYRGAFENRLLARGVRPTTTMEFGSVEAIKQCVMANLGLTLLPEIAVCSEVNQGKLVALPWFEPDFHMGTRLIWHKDKWLSPALQEFIRLSEEILIKPTMERQA